MSQMLPSLVEADQHLQIYDCFMVETMSVINFIVLCEENTAPIKKGNVFLTLLMMGFYDQSIVQIQRGSDFFAPFMPQAISCICLEIVDHLIGL